MTKSSFYTGAALTTVAPPVPDLDSPGTGDSTAPSSFFHDSTAYDNIADPDEFAAAAAASAAASAASAAAAEATRAATAALLPAVTSSDFIVGSASAALSAERVVTDTTSATWDLGTAGQAKVKRAALTGDVTAPADSNATTIANDAVTFAKMQNISTDRLVGRDTAATGDPEEISVGGGLEFSGATAIQRSALTGDVTATAGSGATTIANDAVTFAKMQNVATDSLIGRDTAGTGDPENITLNATMSMTGAGALQREALTGDVTAPAGSNATTIANNAVTYAKMQDIATDSLIGRDTAATGDPETISLNATLSMTGASALQRAALTGDVTAAAGSNTTALSSNLKTITITAVIDGGGATITTGVKGDIEVPFACTITQATLLADQSGSIVVNVWKDTYANYPPTVADKITASAPPTITTATKSQDATLTGWTTSITAGDTIRFNVDSVTTIQRVTLSLRCTKSQ